MERLLEIINIKQRYREAGGQVKKSSLIIGILLVLLGAPQISKADYGYLADPDDSKMVDEDGLTVYLKQQPSLDTKRWIPPSKNGPEEYTSQLLQGEHNDTTRIVVDVSRDANHFVKTFDDYKIFSRQNAGGSTESTKDVDYSENYLNIKKGFYVSCDKLKGPFQDPASPTEVPENLKNARKTFNKNCDPITVKFCDELTKIFEPDSKDTADLKYCQDFESRVKNRLTPENKALDIDNVNADFADFQKKVAQPALRGLPNSTLQMVQSRQMSDINRILDECRSKPMKNMFYYPPEKGGGTSSTRQL